jgi:hypothetical protein
MLRTVRRTAAVLFAASFAMLALAGSASAATSCSVDPASQPFKPWLDFASYTLVPGGRFESSPSGWTLSGSAATAAGNEPWRVAGASDARSLVLPAGSSATSPSFCGGLGYPTVRLFSKSSRLLLSSLRVEVLYTGDDGLLHSFGLGTVLPTSSWQPSVPVLTLSGLPLLTGSSLALRLTAVGGTFSVDDVYVDPYSRN